VRYFKAVDKSKVGWDWKGFLLTALVSFVIAILMYGLVFERVRVGELGKRFAE
jgi:hypothetical protein